MAKLESSLKNMILSLTCICVVAGGVLAGVYMLTLETINAAAEQKKMDAEAAVLNGQEGVAVMAEEQGFGGLIKVMVGISNEGEILGYEVLDCSQETPGLGSKCVDWFKNAEKAGQNIVGRKATGKFIVSKDATAETDENDRVDAITAATISSRAFLKAINSACAQVNGADCCSGATQMAVPAEEHHCEHACGGECKGDGSCGKCQGACGHHEEGACEHHCEHHCNH